ncbi:MAG: endonuclease/exonuclease/phosphatase family protein [Thioalkalivibrionaceae bacterium]
MRVAAFVVEAGGVSAMLNVDSLDGRNGPNIDEPCSTVSSGEPILSAGDRFRVLSYNVHVGIATTNLAHYLRSTWKHVLPFNGRRANLDRIADFIAGFDVVGLQEVDAGSLRCNFDIPGRLSERGGFPFRYTRINRDLGYARHAMALLSRRAPHNVVMHRLPGAIPGRGSIEAQFRLANGGTLGVFIVHLALSPRARAGQLAYLAEAANAHDRAVVLGDFNCQPKSSEFKQFLNMTGLLPAGPTVATYPAWAPRAALDHILASPQLAAGLHRAYPIKLSDHLPIGVELCVDDAISPPEPRSENRSRRS